jgi:hypothetical protein
MRKRKRQRYNPDEPNRHRRLIRHPRAHTADHRAVVAKPVEHGNCSYTRKKQGVLF